MSLLKAIHQVCSKHLVAIKDRKNTGINSDYATLTAVRQILNPALTEAGLSVSTPPGTLRKEGDTWVIVVPLRVSNGEEEREFIYECPFPEGNRGVNLTQRWGMAQSYGQRYALTGFFCMVTGDDDDAQRMGVQDDRNTGAAPSRNVPWPNLMNGGWKDIPTPDGSAMLGDISALEKKALLPANPDYPGLLAWVADLLTKKLKDHQETWTSFVEWAGTGLPARIEDCTASQLTAAIKTANDLPSA